MEIRPPIFNLQPYLQNLELKYHRAIPTPPIINNISSLNIYKRPEHTHHDCSLLVRLKFSIVVLLVKNFTARTSRAQMITSVMFPLVRSPKEKRGRGERVDKELGTQIKCPIVGENSNIK